jgi:hypothetical protein
LRYVRLVTLENSARVNFNLHLKEESFAINFIQWNGIHVISSSLVFLQGNALAYCLQALEQVLTYQVGWESLSEENILFIVKIVDNVTEQTSSPMKTNVTMYALRIITLVASQPSHGFTKINKAFQSNGIPLCSFSISFNSHITI